LNLTSCHCPEALSELQSDLGWLIWRFCPNQVSDLATDNQGSFTAPPTNGLVITTEPCLNPANGVPFSGTQFDSSQAITQTKLPLVVTALNSQVGTFKDTGFCLDQAGSSVVVNACSGGLSQSWVMAIV
jgi:hypothetical protein